jgi:hypothetical protein
VGEARPGEEPEPERERLIEANPAWAKKSDAEWALYRVYMKDEKFIHLREQGWLMEARKYRNGGKYGYNRWALWLVWTHDYPPPRLTLS